MARDGVVNVSPGILSLTFDIISIDGFGMDLDLVARGDTPNWSLADFISRSVVRIGEYPSLGTVP